LHQGGGFRFYPGLDVEHQRAGLPRGGHRLDAAASNLIADLGKMVDNEVHVNLAMAAKARASAAASASSAV